MSIVRKRSASHKAYIPNNARDNQYIMAEIEVTDALISTVSPNIDIHKSQCYLHFYQSLSNLLFSLCNDFKIDSSILVANDKLIRVRYSQEMHQWQTNQQILFYYDPASHKLQNAVFDANVRANKINLLFLATGDDVRDNAGKFHKNVCNLINVLSEQLGLKTNELRIRDHQHITYDLFAKNKGCIGTQAHKLRVVRERYTKNAVALPEDISEMTYAVVSIPTSGSMLNLVDIDSMSDDPYNPLYTYLTDTFSLVTKRYNLNNGALIANGLIPIVRHSEYDTISSQGELQMLGYNPNSSPCGIVSKWKATEFVDTIHLVFVATQEQRTEYGYGRFLNQIESALKLMATELELQPSSTDITIRFHQHIGYNLNNK